MPRLFRSWKARLLAAAILIPLVIVGGIGLYLANLASALPWQEEPTAIALGITPFAALPGTPVGAGAVSTPAGTPAVAAAAGTVYTIVPESSEARYVVKETVGRLSLPTSAVGRTTAVRGEIALDGDGRPVAGGTIEVDLRTLQSGEGQRDNFIQTVTLKDAPVAELAITGVEGWSGPLVEGEERAVTLLADLTIGGVTRPVAMETTATRTGDTLVGTASTTFTWADFGLKTPNVAAQMISVEDEIRIEIDLTAKAGA